MNIQIDVLKSKNFGYTIIFSESGKYQLPLLILDQREWKEISKEIEKRIREFNE